ncbi:hypothetical protein [Geodermatophilus sp. URMC 64]
MEDTDITGEKAEQVMSTDERPCGQQTCGPAGDGARDHPGLAPHALVRARSAAR